jgi:hypothetical protein
MKTILRSAAIAVLLSAGGATIGAGQAINACYVPAVGAVYLVGLAGLSTTCIAQGHVSINLSSGGGTLGTGAVATANLADGAVTTAKIAAGTSVDRLGGITASSFSLTSHNHDAAYAGLNHNHNTAYAAINHTHGTTGLVDGAVTRAKLAAGVSRAIFWAGVTHPAGQAASVFKSTGGVTLTQFAVGRYDLSFPTDIGSLQFNCATVVVAIEGGPRIFQTIAGPRLGRAENVLRVDAFDAAGSAVNTGFEVTVICQ